MTQITIIGAPELDAHEIVPGLFQGAAPPFGPELHCRGFDLLVLAAYEYQPPRRSFPDVQVLRAPLDDHQDPLTPDEIELIQQIAMMVAEAVLVGRQVLVTCMAGINRSGIIVAMALIYLGYSSDEAIRMVQRRRPGALRNPSFVDHLRMVGRG